MAVFTSGQLTQTADKEELDKQRKELHFHHLDLLLLPAPGHEHGDWVQESWRRWAPGQPCRWWGWCRGTPPPPSSHHQAPGRSESTKDELLWVISSVKATVGVDMMVAMITPKEVLLMMTMTCAASSALLLPRRSRGWPVRPRRTAASTWWWRQWGPWGWWQKQWWQWWWWRWPVFLTPSWWSSWQPTPPHVAETIVESEIIMVVAVDDYESESDKDESKSEVCKTESNIGCYQRWFWLACPRTISNSPPWGSRLRAPASLCRAPWEETNWYWRDGNQTSGKIKMKGMKNC